MDAYHAVLFLHIVTLVVAAAATAVTKLAVERRIRARTVGEALEWHRLVTSASRLFPICLAVFLATGAYMVAAAGSDAWSSGFVVSGFVGVALLLGSGVFLGVKGNALKQVLEKAATSGTGAPAPQLVPPPLVAMLPVINTGIALAVVFDMVTKPSVPVSLAVIAIGIVFGAVAGWRGRRAPATAQQADRVLAGET